MNLYEELKILGERPRPYERYTGETLWNDPHISRQMLRMHLDESTELASPQRSLYGCLGGLDGFQTGNS